MAIAFPLLVLLMMAIVDYGITYGNRVEMFDAARAGTRNAAVGRYANITTCANNFSTGASSQATRFACRVKADAGIDDEKIATKLFYMDKLGRETNDFSEAARTLNEYSVVLCVQISVYSVTGVMIPFLDGTFQHVRSVTKTGRISNANFVMPYEEYPVTSGDATDNWSWCTADDTSGAIS